MGGRESGNPPFFAKVFAKETGKCEEKLFPYIYFYQIEFV